MRVSVESEVRAVEPHWAPEARKLNFANKRKQLGLHVTLSFCGLALLTHGAKESAPNLECSMKEDTVSEDGAWTAVRTSGNGAG